MFNKEWLLGNANYICISAQHFTISEGKHITIPNKRVIEKNTHE